MPKFDMGENVEEFKIDGIGNFKFSATRIDSLGASDEYTLVTIAIDVSGSVYSFKDDITEMLKTIISVCKSHPTSEKILVRVITFNDNINEIHGFKELNEIDENSYSINTRGLTSLYDATYSAVASTIVYGEFLINQNFDANGDIYIITDGADNRSTVTPNTIKDQIDSAIQEEKIESIRTFLIGVNNSECGGYLNDFKKEANLTEFIDAGEASKKNLSKLAQYISQSISAQSQSLGTGGPSQTLTF